jgi:hypothetical protein
MFRYYFSYIDPTAKDKFLRGHSIILSEDNIILAVEKFNQEKPNSDIQGVLKNKV